MTEGTAMKKFNQISLALVLSIVTFSNAAIAQITGTATVAFGATYTYTYNDGSPVNNITWSTTRGAVVGQGGSGNNYTVDITWTSAGTTQLIAHENGSQIASKNITVNSCTIGNPTVTSSTTRCGSGSLTLTATTGSGGTGVRWYQSSMGGSALSSSTSYTTGTLSSNTTLYVVSTASGGCEGYPRTAVPITINALPSPPATVTGASRCGTGSVTLTGTVLHPPAEFLVWYSAATGGSYSGGGYLATGSTYTTPSLSSTTNYYVTTATGNGCESSEARSVVTATINPSPTVYTVGGGGGFCSGGSGVTVTLSGSQTGVNYQLKIDGSGSGGPVAGTGSSLSWNNQTIASTNYAVTATHSTGGCVQAMSGSVSVSVSSLPSSFNITGGGSFCPGGSGVSVGLSGSQSGVNYQLRVNGSNWGSAIAGTGSALNWSGVTATGSCSVQATNASTGCSGAMGGSASISTYALPTQYTVGGGGTICSGQTTSVTLNNSQTGVNYQLKLNGINTGSAIAGEGGFGQTWTGLGTAGSYTVVATNTSTSCVQTMTGSATITVNPLPTQYMVGGGGSYCSGGSGVSVTLSNSVAGTNYQLKINGSNSGSPLSGSGSGLTWSSQTTAGTYTVQATVASTGCSQTMTGSATVTVNPLPTQYTLSGGGGICPGATTSVTLNGSQTGVNYQLKLNGTNSGSAISGTGSSLVFGSLSAAGTYTVVATNATTSCVQTMSGSPTVSINSVPSAPSVSGNARFGSGTLTLSASGGGGGSYQWFDPSNSLLGSASTYTTPSLSSTQTNYLYAKAYSSTGCAGAATWVTVNIYSIPSISSTRAYVVKGGNEMLSTQAGYDTYSWKNSGGATKSTTQSLVTNIPDTYSVTVTKGGVTGPIQYYSLATQLGAVNMNYVVSSVVLADSITDPSTVDALPVAKATQSIQYIDGLGRPVQTVVTQGSPAKKDIVQPNVYDVFGREPIKYLPYVPAEDNGLYKTDPLGTSTYTGSPHYSFYNASSDNIADDVNPYIVTLFEPSPANREIKQGAAGTTWQPNGSLTSFTDNVVKKKYEFNTSADNVIKWKYKPDSATVNHYILSKSGSSVPEYYATNLLTVTKTYDEHNNEVVEFTDKTGHIVLKRLQYATGKYALTYYIHDDFGRLRVVLQPEGSKRLAAEYFNKTVSQRETFLDKWAFRYKYDTRSRIIEKQVPGSGKVLMVYDNRDRLVMSQDSVQTPLKQWLVTKYDTLNRPVIIGIYTHGSVVSQSAMTALISSSKFCENYDSTQVSNHGYTSNVFPTTGYKILTVTYYDKYDFKRLMSDTTAYVYSVDGIGPVAIEMAKKANGMVTGSKVLVLNSSPAKFLWNVTYFDDRYRVVQTITQNNLSGQDRLTNQLDFAGRVKQSKVTHVNSSTTYTMLRKFTYDHTGRITEVKHNFNNQASDVIVFRNEYNELGQLIRKKLHSRDGGSTFKQSTDYLYNIRGWLRTVNDPTSPEPSDLFSLELRYDSPSSNGGTAQYNGNISESIWRGAGPDKESYGYYYDSLNRLKEARYFNLNNSSINTRFNEIIGGVNAGGYDLNGNILKVTRNGRKDATTYGAMDNLTYTYTGNQLTRVDDVVADNANELGFRESVETANEYTYDENGSMNKDLNKSLGTIIYNHLNLPRKVYKSGADSVVYTYDATGRKLKQQVYGSSPKTTDYAGEFVYENSTLQFVNTEEGRLLADASPGAPYPWEYQYHLKDHLGNVRLTFSSKTVTESPVATMETANASNESPNFLYYNEAVILNTTLFDHTNTGGTYYSTRLNGSANERTGLARSISVMPRDTVKAEVYVKYLDTNSSNWTTALNNLMTSVANGTAPAGTFVDGGLTGSTGGATPPYLSLLNKGSETGTAPKAYLNYLVFDREYNVLDGGFIRVSTAGREYGQDGPHEKLSTQIVINKPGYVYLYISNDNAALGGSQVEVYFDDFKVTHVKSPIISSQDYFPFGLSFNSYQRENALNNQYQYNGKEFQDELSLGWLDYQARQYDPAIARWMAPDPLSGLSRRHSPYAYCYNNPLIFVDPDGMFGDYYNKAGEHLGSDGIDDNKIYQTTNEVYNENVSEKGCDESGPDFEAVKNSGDTHYLGETNEFGLIQLTGMGNEHIANYGSEDTYSYTDSEGNAVASGQHGDDWVTPEVGSAFNAAVNDLASEAGNENIVVNVNDASAFNPTVNLGHATHFEGKSIDMPFLTTGGAPSNNINSLTAGDTALNGNLVGKLQGSGFTKNYSNNGTIPGTTHAAGHKDHLHVGKP
jgi:RHS repeat-associated protein